jgi:putative hydrolase of the HAD superfamily
MSGKSDNHHADLKAVIFDYGEVLCSRPTPAETARIADIFGVGVDQFADLWERNRGLYDRGDLTPEAYWSMLAEDAGAKIAPDQMDEICQLDVAMWSHVNPGMVEWALRLASARIKVGLLSNMHPGMVKHARTHFAWLNRFDCVTFSADVRLIKPDPAIYEHILRGLAVTASEALFLDDREINIRAARALGMKAIRFQSLAELRADLEKVGFTTLPPNS